MAEFHLGIVGLAMGNRCVQSVPSHVQVSLQEGRSPNTTPTKQHYLLMRGVVSHLLDASGRRHVGRKLLRPVASVPDPGVIIFCIRRCSTSEHYYLLTGGIVSEILAVVPRGRYIAWELL